MAKLIINYRIKDNENDYFKGKTYFDFCLESKTTMISIAPNETRTLNEIVSEIENNLQDGYHLEKDEEFEISEYDSIIMKYGEEYNKKVLNKNHNILKKCYLPIKDGRISNADEIMKFYESEVNADVSNF